MKVLILHPSSRYDRYLPDIPAAGRMELVFTDRELDGTEIPGSEGKEDL